MRCRVYKNYLGHNTWHVTELPIANYLSRAVYTFGTWAKAMHFANTGELNMWNTSKDIDGRITGGEYKRSNFSGDLKD